MLGGTTASTSSRRAGRPCSRPPAASFARSRRTTSAATSCGYPTTIAGRRSTMRTSTDTTSRRGSSVEIGDTLGFVGNTGQRAHDGAASAFRRLPSRAGAARPVSVRVPLGCAAARDRRRHVGDRYACPVSRSAPLSGIAGPRVADAHDRGRGERRCGSMPPREAGFVCGCRTGPPGYVASRLVESTRKAVRHATVSSGTPLRDRPAADASIIATAPGGALPVIGQFADYALVDTGEGRTAWVPVRPAETSGRPATR